MTDGRAGTGFSHARLQPFEICVQSGERAVREALSQVLEQLRPLQLDVEEKGTVELVLAEVLNNIVEHAYPADAPAGPIAISCCQAPNGLMVHIRDRGSVMPEGQLPLGLPANLDVAMDDMPEGGFGWFLIQNLAKDVQYDRVGNENHLNMRLAVAMSS